jgi:hypothetical protein
MTSNQITTATNVGGPNLANASSDARRYFNNFYSIPFNVSAEANDAIVAFFQEYADNDTAAQNLAAAVLYTAFSQNLDPLQVLAQFEKLPKGELSNYLIAFLNSTRIPTSTLGVNTHTKQTSIFVNRTILV